MITFQLKWINGGETAAVVSRQHITKSLEREIEGVGGTRGSKINGDFMTWRHPCAVCREVAGLGSLVLVPICCRATLSITWENQSFKTQRPLVSGHPLLKCK